ncbi:hypothetical protein D3C78_1117210 [compost metagenome]
MAERGDFARQPETRGIDEAQQIEGQRRVLLEQVLDFRRAGLLAHQVDELENGGLRRAYGLRAHQVGVGKPVALEIRHAQVAHQFELLGGFHLFGHDLGLGIGARELHQRLGILGRKGLEVELDVGGHGQPARVGAAQQALVEGQAKAALAQGVKDWQPRFDVGLRGVVAQRGHFQHHLVGMDQFEVAARQAFLCAVDEHRFLSDQGFGTGIGQGVEQQRRIAGRSVGIVGGGTVEQLIAVDLALFVDDGLPRDDGQIAVVYAFGQGGRSGRGGVGCKSTRHKGNYAESAAARAG